MQMNEKTLIKVLEGVGVSSLIIGIYELFKNVNNDDQNHLEIPKDSLPYETKELHYFLEKAEQNLIKGNYRYALFDARLVLQNALKLYLDRNNCVITDDRTVKYLVACEDNDLIDEELINKLHKARRYCNLNSHNLTCENITQENTNYAINQIKDLLSYVDNFINESNKEGNTNA